MSSRITYQTTNHISNTKDYIMTKTKLSDQEAVIAVKLDELSNDGLSLEEFDRADITFDMCIVACTENGLALEYVPWDMDNYDDICNVACEENGLALEFAEEQNDEMCEIACDENGLALGFVITQTLGMCEIAHEQNSNASEFMEDWAYEEMGF